MRWLTKEEHLILDTCPSDSLRLKSAICLMLGIDGGIVEQYPRQLVGTGLYRERKIMVKDEYDLPEEVVIAEEQMMLCGLGVLNWWAKIVWVPCQKRGPVYHINTELMRRVRHVHAHAERTAGESCTQG
jgi:hypothetical protein